MVDLNRSKHGNTMGSENHVDDSAVIPEEEDKVGGSVRRMKSWVENCKACLNDFCHKLCTFFTLFVLLGICIIMNYVM